MVVDFDDLGMDITISDQCRTRDCRKELDELHYANPAFKVTLFAVPYRMSVELLEWCRANKSWVELAVHGWDHHDNYECEDWSPLRMAEVMDNPIIQYYFSPVFKAPGWQISDGCYKPLKMRNWVVADQAYNDDRRPPMYVYKVGPDSWHGHTWNCMGNGIEETFDQLKEAVINATEFKFVSEAAR